MADLVPQFCEVEQCLGFLCVQAIGQYVDMQIGKDGFFVTLQEAVAVTLS